MIIEHLVHFTLVILVQFIFFAVHAYKVGEGQMLFHYLKRGMLLGLPFGIVFDLLIGHTFGMYDYALGYTWWFLTINGLFSWGFMIANIFLLQHHSIWHMYRWSVALAIVYEIANYFLPVWEWTFYSNTPIEYGVVILAAYAGLTAALMVAMRLTYKFHFRLMPF
jgi:hypothetical protein